MKGKCGAFLQKPDGFRCMEVPFPERGQAPAWGAIDLFPAQNETDSRRLRLGKLWEVSGCLPARTTQNSENVWTVMQNAPLFLARARKGLGVSP